MRKVSVDESIILYYTIVPLLQKFQKWRLSRFAIKLFIYSYLKPLKIITDQFVLFYL